MRPVTCEEMRRLDRAAIDDYGIPGLLLMENAGRGVCEVLCREFQPGRVVVFSGKGNNGGDGFVVARHLVSRGYDVQVVLLEDPLHLKPDPRVNFTILEKLKLPLFIAGEETTEKQFAVYCQGAGLVVDAIFGIGINSPVCGRFERAIRAIVQSGKPVLSIDTPSGLDADTGRVCGVAVKASVTVTLGLVKKGFFEGSGPEYTGKIEVIDIGIPRELTAPFLK